MINMKNIAKILVLMVVVFTTYSCSEEYDDYNADTESIVGFADLLGIAQVPLGEETVDIEIEFLSSDIASTERSFQVIVVAEGTNIAAENYTFNSSVTLPANQQSGTFIFTAVDVSLTDDFGDVFLGFESNDLAISNSQINIKVRSLN
ncbi:MAG: hypothetical protein ACJAX7_000283 [Saprospiraceae bacterium]|jgi:hypothetical protein